ncbi:hypothetical protein D3C75_998190 [compost metagenome]
MGVLRTVADANFGLSESVGQTTVGLILQQQKIRIAFVYDDRVGPTDFDYFTLDLREFIVSPLQCFPVLQAEQRSFHRHMVYIPGSAHLHQFTD